MSVERRVKYLGENKMIIKYIKYKILTKMCQSHSATLVHNNVVYIILSDAICWLRL